MIEKSISQLRASVTRATDDENILINVDRPTIGGFDVVREIDIRGKVLTIKLIRSNEEKHCVLLLCVRCGCLSVKLNMNDNLIVFRFLPPLIKFFRVLAMFCVEASPPRDRKLLIILPMENFLLFFRMLLTFPPSL